MEEKHAAWRLHSVDFNGKIMVTDNAPLKSPCQESGNKSTLHIHQTHAVRESAEPHNFADEVKGGMEVGQLGESRHDDLNLSSLFCTPRSNSVVVANVVCVCLSRRFIVYEK